MSDVSSVQGRKYNDHEFSAADRHELQSATSTDDIVRRATKSEVHVHGNDRTQRQVKEHQQGEVGIAGGVGIAHAAGEGVGISGVHIGGPLAAATAEIALPLIGLGVGVYELLEARKNGAEQHNASVRENMHVAVLGSLDLPADYRAQRKAQDFSGVPDGDKSTAAEMSQQIASCPGGKAALQLQCDRGIHAAKDMIASGMTAESFLKANPKIADTYAKDAAFHEGFNAYLYAAGKKDGGAMKKEMDDGLATRDGWHAQEHVSVRA